MDEISVTIVRSIIAFATLFLFTRMLGKQQVGQLTSFEYVAGITIGSIASSLSVDLATKPLPQFVGLVVWVVLVFGMQVISIKYRWFSKVFNDQPTIVIQKGKILEQNLKKMRYRHDDILQLLRDKDVFDITQVEYALIEPSGKLSVLKKAEHETVKVKDLKLVPEVNGLMVEVIQDGKVIKENLQNKNKTDEWLMQQLQAQGVKDIKEVSIGIILPNGQLYIDRFDDRLKEVDIGDYQGPY